MIVFRIAGMTDHTARERNVSMTVLGGYILLSLLALTNGQATVNRTAKQPLRIVTILEPPFVMKDPATGKFSGLMIDVLNEAGITIDHIDTPMHDTYGWEEHPGEFNGAIGDLIAGKYDLAVAPFSIRAQRAKVVSFTQPIIHNGYMVLYKMPENTEFKFKTSTIATIFKPFSLGLWCLIILMGVVVSVFLYVIRRFSPYEYEVTTAAEHMADNSLASKSWASGLMYLLGSLTGRNASVAPRSPSGRALTAVWWMFSLMTVGAYIAGLVVVLFRYNPHIDSLPFATMEEMIAGNQVKVLGVKESAIYKYMAGQNAPLEKSIFEYWKKNWDDVMVNDLTTALKMMEEGDGKYAVFMEEASASYLASKEPCNKMIIGGPVGDDTVGFVCRKGTTVCEDMNHVILNLMETGKIEFLREKWFLSGCHVTHNVYQEERPVIDGVKGKGLGLLSPHSITIKLFSGAFLVLTAGFVLAVLILVAEIVVSRRKGDIHHRLKNVQSRHEDARGIRDSEFQPGQDI